MMSALDVMAGPVTQWFILGRASLDRRETKACLR